MSHDVQLLRIKKELDFIKTISPEDILSNSTLKRALIGSLYLIVKYLPRDVLRIKIDYSSAPGTLKSKLIRSIIDTEYTFKDKELISFFEIALPKIYNSVVKILSPQ